MPRRMYAGPRPLQRQFALQAIAERPKTAPPLTPAEQASTRAALDAVLAPDRTLNVALQEGDIVYVPRSGIATVGFWLSQVNPFAMMLSVQSIAANASGQ